jgi:hypothetical protein
LLYVSQEALEPPWKFEKRVLVLAQGDDTVASLLEREKFETNESTLRDGFNFGTFRCHEDFAIFFLFSRLDVSRGSRLDSLYSSKILLLTKGSKRESATPRLPFSVWPGDLLKEGRSMSQFMLVLLGCIVLVKFCAIFVFVLFVFISFHIAHLAGFVRAADRRAFGVSSADAPDGGGRANAGYRHSQGRLGGGPRGLGLKMPGRFMRSVSLSAAGALFPHS